MEERQEYLALWYDRYEAMKQELGLTNSDIASITGNSIDYINSIAQSKDEIPQWLKLAIVVHERWRSNIINIGDGREETQINDIKLNAAPAIGDAIYVNWSIVVRCIYKTLKSDSVIKLLSSKLSANEKVVYFLNKRRRHILDLYKEAYPKWGDSIDEIYNREAGQENTDYVKRNYVPLKAVNVYLPPVVNITTPSNNASYESNETVRLSATASGSYGNVLKVDFYANSLLIGSVTSSPYTINWDCMNPDEYVLTAVATDNKGISTISSPVSIRINTIERL